jgi:PAS domain S-box-containing protein
MTAVDSSSGSRHRRGRAAAIMALSMLVPLVLLSTVTVRVSTDIVRRQAERQLEVAARAGGVAITQQMEGLAELVDSFARRPTLIAAVADVDPDRDPNRIRSHLEGLRQARPGIDVAFLADPQGRLVDILPETPQIIGDDFSHRDWYTGVTTSGTAYVSELYRSAAAGEPLVVGAASPIVASYPTGDRVIGILVAAYSVGSMQTFVDDFASAEGVHLTVYDQRGAVVAKPGSAPAEVVRRSDDPLVHAALAGGSGVGEATTDGSSQLVAYSPVTDVGWAVTADVPSDVALVDAQRVRNGVLGAAVLLGLITLAGVALLARAERDRDLAVARLEGSEAFLDSVVENIPNMVFVKDANELRFVRFNRAGEKLIGRAREDMLGKNDFDLFPADQARAFTDKDRAVLATGELADIGLEPIDTPGHGERLLHTRKIPILDPSGAPAFLLGISDDVTEREEAKRAVEQARDEADRANRAKSEFLSRMSHELRTPLNSVLGFSQLLALDELTDEQRENVALIRSAGRHLLTLIDEVLEIAQIEAGRLRVSLEPVHVSDVVHDALDLVHPAAVEADVTIPADPPGCDAWITADRQRLLQVLLNLLSNAIKYNRKGGAISIVCERSAGTVSLAVIDTGIGISSSNLAKLFTPFERLGAEQSGVEGTGVGLALSRLLCQQMGGSLAVSSTVGVGSMFTLEMPAGDPAVVHLPLTPAVAHPETEPHASDAPVRVLYIEDNVANLRVVERAMATRTRVELIGAMQGSIGIELARQHQPELIILDLHLPDMPGDQVLARLAGDPATAAIPVVICTADATPGEAPRLLAAGASGYLTKPIDLAELFAVVERARRGEPVMPGVAGGADADAIRDRVDRDGTRSWRSR